MDQHSATSSDMISSASSSDTQNNPGFVEVKSGKPIVALVIVVLAMLAGIIGLFFYKQFITATSTTSTLLIPTQVPKQDTTPTIAIPTYKKDDINNQAFGVSDVPDIEKSIKPLEGDIGAL